ncbi:MULTISPECIES: hypothetical protein [Massilia]|jgi:hypothetical protein|uniref:hypothetical protein n=1 Tax=Massilia TaxID=149698 RepID=UPI001C62AB21|nr:MULTISPECIES: hypothetical protein [Massilia]QYG02268.1 hypothetical protein KY496_02135 [Massilia sp. NP310]
MNPSSTPHLAPPLAPPSAPPSALHAGGSPDTWQQALLRDPARQRGAARARREQWLMIACFFMLFPGFFFYHTLLGTGTTGAFLGGYFAPVALAFAGPMCLVYLARMRRDAKRLTLVDVHYGVFFAYFVGVVVVNAAAGANRAIVAYHMLAILFMVLVYLQFCFIDFDSRRFRVVGLLSLAGMSTIVFSYSVDGVFYLGALGIAKDANSLATYQGFSRSYLFTYLAVVTFTRNLPLRLVLHAVGAATLFVNTARSEFVALLFAIPLIEFYYSRHKLYFVLAGVCIAAAIGLYLDQILASLPSNRILELFDLSHSTSANKRQQLTVHAVQSIAAHPILGDYGSYKPGHYSHNVLSAWVDLGLFGMLYVAALAIVPITPMFFHEYFAARRRPLFLLAFAFACVTVLLLLSSHYFTDMLLSATLGACSRYAYERKHAAHRPPDLGAPALRHQDLRQAMPNAGQPRS